MRIEEEIKEEKKEKREKKTPVTCFTCGTVYDKEVGKGRRHKFILDPLVGMVDYYFILMDKVFDMPERVKNRIAKKKMLKTQGDINGSS